MAIKAVSFVDDHIEDATQLASHRYSQLRASVPSLPARYGERDVLASMLHDLSKNAAGVAAFDGKELVGFLLAMTIPDFRGRQTVYSPEWANAAILERAGDAYERMVATLSAQWYADGSTSFLAALFADNQPAADTLFRLGFGMLAMDAMRDLNPPQGKMADVEIKRASLDDLDALETLDAGLGKHLRSAPVFLLQYLPHERASLALELQDERYRFFLACQSGEAVAFMKIGPATEDASTIIRDEGTASITGAYALPRVRGQGVSTALLTRCIDWARSAGYERCGVDFEPTNVEANRFWRYHFQPVCFGVQRLLNIG